ncbi:endopeptidase La [Thiomicrorhabdus heinhorstiae]|uniref:Lon protease n=1 Tax=Thiomicrorhabdus heinhorstiae TaxID=2748010 RepID=A0ABS0BSU1_9GAMM|nr:endopeptidase La [Thiomicrorhabdus heinhorstiae]MBF6056922.1 endopeptidase La [Thiomicrorhabdus heinhorstiae]
MNIDQIEMKMNVLVLPLRDVVVFPGNVMPLFVGREKSIRALNEAMNGDKQIFLVAQKSAELDVPTLEDLYEVGTMANILQLLKLPDGTVKVLVEGVERFQLLSLNNNDNVLMGDVQVLQSVEDNPADKLVLMRTLKERFAVFTDHKKKIPSEVRSSVQKEENPDRMVDLISANLNLGVKEKQTLLEMTSVTERLERVLAMVETELELLESEKRITTRVKKQMDKTQREYYLNEKIKAIHSELAGGDEAAVNEMDQLNERIEKAGMSDEAKQKAQSELKKLKMMPSQSSEATVVRNYLDWLIDIPWKKRSRVSNDLPKAQTILDSQHYGLEKVKERIIEYLAVQKRVKKMKGPILCLVGPPGVGKTSLAKSIAEATNRKYVRMALGGVRDEAEIRGHRKTYIGALPGKIIQKMQSAGTRNPLFLLDEIDKMSSDMRGDPAAALLEVLDPEQNHSFNDHYLEVDYDLSDVMFVATSNSMDIPEALLDRMEVINLSGYTEPEKLNIAQRHLLPKSKKEHGIKEKELEVTEGAIRGIIQTYTREAGVRLLARELAKICRKAVKKLVFDDSLKTIRVDAGDLEEYLGVARYRIGLADEENRIGQVAGLAWTRVGGDLLRIEATAMPGKGKLSSTGQLGSVMQESVQTAMSVIRSRSEDLGLTEEFYENFDLHLHFPEGATKKDGPSAGIAICTAITSALTNIPVKAEVAMTGEITLRGEVLPIGGLKEKLLAALRGGIKTVLIPHDNVRDLADVPDEVKNNLDIHPVQWVDEVLELALTTPPKLLKSEDEKGVEAEIDPPAFDKNNRRNQQKNRSEHH